MLKGCNILLGVTGGIACYKSCDMTSKLIKLGANVQVIMTANSLNFVAPLTFESLTNRPVTTDTFIRDKQWDIAHISLAKFADVLVVAPATANIIAKVASGICDDMLSTTICATSAKVVFAPAMNMAMYNNPIVQSNIAKLKSLGYYFIEPGYGRLACGDEGVGKMAEPQEIIDFIKSIVSIPQDLLNKNVLITLGATEEPIDAVRVITNHSSGKMGVALAEECNSRGANVTIVSGKASVALPQANRLINVNTTCEMYDSVLANINTMDYIIMAAAPADYRVENVAMTKVKSEKITLNLVKNPDIAAAVGKQKDKAKLVIFSAETDNVIANANGKLARKNADMVIANDVTASGAGFNVDTNIITIIKCDGSTTDYPLMHKRDVAAVIVDNMINL